jgi:hypothetical protein
MLCACTKRKRPASLSVCKGRKASFASFIRAAAVHATTRRVRRVPRLEAKCEKTVIIASRQDVILAELHGQHGLRMEAIMIRLARPGVRVYVVDRLGDEVREPLHRTGSVMVKAYVSCIQ